VDFARVIGIWALYWLIESPTLPGFHLSVQSDGPSPSFDLCIPNILVAHNATASYFRALAQGEKVTPVIEGAEAGLQKQTIIGAAPRTPLAASLMDQEAPPAIEVMFQVKRVPSFFSRAA
jgi:hypothetical protein